MPVSSPDMITLVDVSNPEAPTVRWADWPAPQGTGFADILARDSLLFCVRGSDGLSSFDFSDIDAPKPLDVIAPPSPFTGAFGSSSKLALRGDFAIVTVELAGVAAANITDPENLEWVSLAKTDSPASGLALLGARAIASSDYGGVWDMDFSDPEHPKTLGGYLFPGVIQGLAANSSSRVHAACDMGGYQLLDFTDPAHPVRPGALTEHNENGWPRVARCGLLGDKVLVGRWTHDDSFQQLQTVSVADPAHPTVLGGCNLGEPDVYLQDMAMAGDFGLTLYDNLGMEVADCRVPANPSFAASLPQSDSSVCIQAGDGVAYTGTLDGTICIADVSDPLHPVDRGTVVTTATSSQAISAVARRGNLLVAAQNGVLLFDVSSPFAPVQVGEIPMAESVEIFGLALDGNVLYLTRYDLSLALDTCKVEAYDVSNPAVPALLADKRLPASPTIVVPVGDTVFVGDWTGGVYQLRLAPEGCRLRLSASDSPDPVNFIGQVTYTIDVTNHGPLAAENVVVTDVVPGGATVVGVISPTPASKAPATRGKVVETVTTVTAYLGTVPVGETKRVKVVVKPYDLGTMANTASVTASNLIEPVPPVVMTTDVRKGNGPDLAGLLYGLRETCTWSRGVMWCKMTGTYACQNIGNMTATRCYIRIFVSDDPFLDISTDTCVNSLTRSVSGVKPRQVVRLPFSFNLPANVSLRGKYMIGWVQTYAGPADTYPKNDIAVFGPIP